MYIHIYFQNVFINCKNLNNHASFCLRYLPHDLIAAIKFPYSGFLNSIMICHKRLDPFVSNTSSINPLPRYAAG